MPRLKIACWNIYFSWNLVKKTGTHYRIAQKTRSKNVANIVRAMDADILGIVECMSKDALSYFRDQQCPQYDGLMVEGTGKLYNLGLLYKKSKVDVRRVSINTNDWKTKIGNDRVKKTYKFARDPLVASITHRDTGKSLLVAIVHAKSKRPKSGLTKEQKNAEAIRNRKRIVAEGLRLRELLLRKIAASNTPYQRMLIMGDINDGPGFDRYEARISRSGVEAHIGSVLDPDAVLHSFVDLSDGVGVPTSSYKKGTIQLDHILYTHALAHGRGKPKVVPKSGDVRSDLVNIKEDGKRRDSDHAPVEIVINF